MQNNTKVPTGRRLHDMRIAAGFKTIATATARANTVASSMDSPVRFSMNSMRRFESVGTKTTSYGSTPPTYEELNILMRAYNGSPGYLILGVPPATYPVEYFDLHKKNFFTDDMIDLMSDVASWHSSRQKTFFKFYNEFIKH